MRTIVSRQFTVDKSYVEIFGTSSESKPTAGIVTGSRYTEVDTGDVYLFNETASEWVKQPAQGGGSGGGVLVVTLDSDTGALDKTWQELFDATFPVIRIVSHDAMILYYVQQVFERAPLGGGDTEYIVQASFLTDFIEFVASSASGYPVPQE